MAEDDNAGEQPKSTKRRLRASTETIRERNQRLGEKQEAETVKRAEKSETPSGFKVFVSGFTWPVRKLGQGLRVIGRFLGRYRVFRFLGRLFYPRWLRNSWAELRQVTWPGRKKSWQLTYAVLIFSVIFGIIVAALDFALDKLFKEIIIK